jgi:hypothetical protein
MMSIVKYAATVLIAATGLMQQNSAAFAQLSNRKKVTVEYGQPANQAHRNIETILKRDKSIEAFASFINRAYNLKEPITISIKECPKKETNAWYFSRNNNIVMCYGLIFFLVDQGLTISHRISPKKPQSEREKLGVKYGTEDLLLAALTHEFAHAVFDQINFKFRDAITEEKNADIFGAILLLQHKNGLDMLIMQALFFYEQDASNSPNVKFNNHPSDIERARTYACFIQGAALTKGQNILKSYSDQENRNCVQFYLSQLEYWLPFLNALRK